MEHIDRISDLPESMLLHILSFIPTHLVARTSLISQRFRHLWKSSPVLDLDYRHIRQFREMVDCALFQRNPSNPLQHLRLNYHRLNVGYDSFCVSASYLKLLLIKAQSLGVKHLSISVSLPDNEFADMFSIILSFDKLRSLQIHHFTPLKGAIDLSYGVSLTRLKSLSISLRGLDFDCDKFNELVSKLCFLEDLSTSVFSMNTFNLSSHTVKILNLSMWGVEVVRLSMPNLESFDFKNLCAAKTPRFSCELPQLRNAFICLDSVCQINVPEVFTLLRSLRNVEQLKFDVMENWTELFPFHILLEPGKELPIFENLKCIHLYCCFHDKNIEDVISLLYNSPALQSLKLVHKGPNILKNIKNVILWKSKLPPNDESNSEYAYFKDLHINKKRNELVVLLTKKPSSKRLKIRKYFFANR